MIFQQDNTSDFHINVEISIFYVMNRFIYNKKEKTRRYSIEKINFLFIPPRFYFRPSTFAEIPSASKID